MIGIGSHSKISGIALFAAAGKVKSWKSASLIKHSLNCTDERVCFCDVSGILRAHRKTMEGQRGAGVLREVQ